MQKIYKKSSLLHIAMSEMMVGKHQITARVCIIYCLINHTASYKKNHNFFDIWAYPAVLDMGLARKVRPLCSLGVD